MRPALTLVALLAFAAAPALAEPPVTTTVRASYDDVQFDLENAITDAGLVVSSVNHVGDMLERTKEDVGGTITLFTHAEIYSFCSAEVSRQVMEADLANVQYCPYKIFLYERPGDPGSVTVGHILYPDGAMEAVNALLDEIIASALTGY